MSVGRYLEEAGGFATRAALVAATSRADVDTALARGELVADGRGRYATPATDVAVRAAHALSGVLCLTSAALHHGWEVRDVPDRPHVLVPRRRRVRAGRRAGVRLHYADLDPAEVSGVVTGVELTLRQCLCRLPRADALAIADSALRHGVPPSALRRAALSARGPGAPQARFVAAQADGDAANPFESVLRDLSLEVAGLHLVPQRTITGSVATVRPDLVDHDLRIVVEADSFRWHGGRDQLARDARRYNLLVADGWIVLRFAWEDVMFDPSYVQAVLTAVVERRAGSTTCRCGPA